jgi:hypothetical protein
VGLGNGRNGRNGKEGSLLGELELDPVESYRAF